jgi:hypothetical protein
VELGRRDPLASVIKATPHTNLTNPPWSRDAGAAIVWDLRMGSLRT